MDAGLAAEFSSETALSRAAELLSARGYRTLDACTPFPVEGLEAKLRLGRSPLGWILFPIGLGGAVFAFWLQWYCNARSYPIDVGGRPNAAWPAFVIIGFETMVLASAVLGVVILLALLRLPATTSPLFAVEGFERASIDRFWLTVAADDPRFDRARTEQDLVEAGAERVAAFGRAR